MDAWLAIRIVMIPAGLVVCFLGYRIRKVLTGLLGLTAGFLAGFQVSSLFLGSIWVCLAVGGAAAVLLAVLAFRFYLTGLFFLCSILLFFVVSALLRADTVPEFLLCLPVAVAAGAAGVYYAKPMLWGVTAVGGAFAAFFAGCSLAGRSAPVLLTVLPLVLAACGIVVQYFDTKRSEMLPHKAGRPSLR